MMTLILGIPLFFMTLAVSYLSALGLASRVRMPEALPPHIPTSRFAIVVPAHDEEKGLGATISSLRGLDYPPGQFDIVVVADNCSDLTAEVAKTSGARCLERFDPARRGKGYALAFAFAALMKEDFDAMVVVDADNIMSANFLQAMDARLRVGQSVIQSRNSVRNPLENALTWMLAVGNAIENLLYSQGKENLNLSSPLRGTGMCLSSAMLRRMPWDTCSVAEDTEYGLRLIAMGERVYFAPEAEVLSDAPVNVEMLAAQRIRWASGNMRLAKSTAVGMIVKGISTGRFVMMDAGWSMLIRSKPLLLTVSVLLFAAALGSGTMIPWSATVLLLWTAYFCAGILAAGVSSRSLRLTLAAPFHLFWLVGISILGLFGFREKCWTRTGRT